MRVSSNPNDGGYIGAAGRARVLLDGVEQRMVETADDVMGVVISVATQDDQRMLAVDDAGNIVRVIHHGVVTIERLPDAW